MAPVLYLSPSRRSSSSSKPSILLPILDFNRRSKMSGAPLDMTLDDLIKSNKKSGSRGRGRGSSSGSGPGPNRRFSNRSANRAAPYAVAKVRSVISELQFCIFVCFIACCLYIYFFLLNYGGVWFRHRSLLGDMTCFPLRLVEGRILRLERSYTFRIWTIAFLLRILR